MRQTIAIATLCLALAGGFATSEIAAAPTPPSYNRSGDPVTPVPAPPQRSAQWAPAFYCITQFGVCPLPTVVPAGTQCYCLSVYGQVFGFAG